MKSLLCVLVCLVVLFASAPTASASFEWVGPVEAMVESGPIGVIVVGACAVAYGIWNYFRDKPGVEMNYDGAWAV